MTKILKKLYRYKTKKWQIKEKIGCHFEHFSFLYSLQMSLVCIFINDNPTFLSVVLLRSEFPIFHSVLFKKSNREKTWTKTKRFPVKTITFVVKDYDLSSNLYF